MKLSIIIPVYKVEAYLDECLGSILGKDASDAGYEVVLVNDGSPDNSMAVASRYASVYPNLRIIEQENQGLSAARMNGLAAAQGDYVWFVDGDDYLYEGAIRSVLSLLDNAADNDVFMFPLNWTYEDGTGSRQDFSLQDGDTEMPGRDVLRRGTVPIWASQRFLVCRRLFESPYIYFPKGLLHEDEYFGRVLLYQADRVRVMASPVYNYRQRKGSITGSCGIRSSYDIVEIYKHLLSYSESVVAPEDKEWFGSQCAVMLLQSYLKVKSSFGTDEFKEFHKRYSQYVISEYDKHAAGIPFRDRLTANLLVRHPNAYVFLSGIAGRDR